MHARARARRSSSSRESERCRSEIYKPTSPGRRQMSVVGLRRDHAAATPERVARRRRTQLERRPQQLRAHHRRGTAAAATSASTAASTSGATRSASRPRSRRSSTTRTAPRASRCSTTRTARSATSSRRVGLAVGDEIVVGPDRRDPARQRAAAREHPARHGGPRRRAEARQGRAAGALGRRRRAADGARGRLRARCACRAARTAWCTSRCTATIGQVGNLEHENVAHRQGRPLALARQAPERPRRRDEPGRSPDGRRRGQVLGRPPSVHAVGQADQGPQDAQEQAHRHASSSSGEGRSRLDGALAQEGSLRRPEPPDEGRRSAAASELASR